MTRDYPQRIALSVLLVVHLLCLGHKEAAGTAAKQEEGLVSIHAKVQPLSAVLDELAAQSGLALEAAPGFQEHKVVLWLQRRSLQQAMEALRYGLAPTPDIPLGWTTRWSGTQRSYFLWLPPQFLRENPLPLENTPCASAVRLQRALQDAVALVYGTPAQQAEVKQRNPAAGEWTQHPASRAFLKMWTRFLTDEQRQQALQGRPVIAGCYDDLPADQRKEYILNGIFGGTRARFLRPEERQKSLTPPLPDITAEEFERDMLRGTCLVFQRIDFQAGPAMQCQFAKVIFDQAPQTNKLAGGIGKFFGPSWDLSQTFFEDLDAFQSRFSSGAAPEALMQQVQGASWLPEPLQRVASMEELIRAHNPQKYTGAPNPSRFQWFVGFVEKLAVPLGLEVVAAAGSPKLPFYTDSFSLPQYQALFDLINTLQAGPPLTVGEVLNRLGMAFGYLWAYRDGILIFRDRLGGVLPDDAPPRWGTRWRRAENGFQPMTLEEYAAIATFSDAQLAKLSPALVKTMAPVRRYLVFYATLATQQKQQIQSSQGIPLARVSPMQLDALLQAGDDAARWLTEVRDAPTAFRLHLTVERCNNIPGLIATFWAENGKASTDSRPLP